MFYALSDEFTGNDPKEYTHGFCNTKIVIAFKTKKERKEWYEYTKLLTAKLITRKQALKLSEWVTDDYYTKNKFDAVKAVEIYRNNNEDKEEYHTLIGKNF
jgi:hypothetical protein